MEGKGPANPTQATATTHRNASARTFGRFSRLCPLRRSLSSLRIATGQTRHTHAECTKHPNASQPRRRSRTHFVALHTHGFAAESRPHTCRIPTAIQWQTRRVTNRPSEDPGPCRRCAAALSCSADAPTCIPLGTHARSGPRMRRSLQRAVPCGRRNGATLSPTDAPEPTAWRRGSAYPDHRLRGRNRVASPRRDGRIPAGRQSDGNTKSQRSSIG